MTKTCKITTVPAHCEHINDWILIVKYEYYLHVFIRIFNWADWMILSVFFHYIAYILKSLSFSPRLSCTGNICELITLIKPKSNCVCHLSHTREHLSISNHAVMKNRTGYVWHIKKKNASKHESALGECEASSSICNAFSVLLCLMGNKCMKLTH